MYPRIVWFVVQCKQIWHWKWDGVFGAPWSTRFWSAWTWVNVTMLNILQCATDASEWKYIDDFRILFIFKQMCFNQMAKYFFYFVDWFTDMWCFIVTLISATLKFLIALNDVQLVLELSNINLTHCVSIPKIVTYISMDISYCIIMYVKMSTLCANGTVVCVWMGMHWYLDGWVLSINPSPPSAAYMRQGIGSTLFQVIACHLFSTSPIPESMLTNCELDPWEQTSMKFDSKYKRFH